MGKSSPIRWVVKIWLVMAGFTGTSFLPSVGAIDSHKAHGVGGATPDSFSVPLLLENEIGNPYHIVLTFGIHPDGTDGFDSALDQLPPPPPPMGWNFEAYFPLDHQVFSQLRTDIRSDQPVRLVWMIVTRGAEGEMTWNRYAFPPTGTFVLDGVTDMREVTKAYFDFRDTMTITYNKPEALPDIEVGGNEFRFGDVFLGRVADHTFPVLNRGDGDLIINTVVSDRPEFGVVWPSFPQDVVPGGSLEVTLSFMPAALGLFTGSITIHSNDPDEPTVTILLSGTGVSPEIEVSSFSHDFGRVAVGKSAEWGLVVFNKGTGDLVVDTVSSDSPDFAADPVSFSVGPADSQEVRVRFVPFGLGPASGRLTVCSNDPDEPSLTILLAGIGFGPDIELSAALHDFGTVAVGHSALGTLTVLNTGSADLVVEAINCSRPVFSADPTAFTVSPNHARDVGISFVPTAVGAVEGKMEIVSNDPDQPTLTVSLTGVGANPEIYVAETGHDFGQVLVGQSALWSFDVINVGTTPLEVSGVGIDSRGFGVEPTSFTVGPSNLQEVRVTFAPDSAGSYWCQLSVFSNDPDQPAVSLSLTGVGIHGTGVEEVFVRPNPNSFHLYQNAPNPFNPTTTIRYTVPSREQRAESREHGAQSKEYALRTTLKIYTILGQEIRTLVDKAKEPGSYSVTWDGQDRFGNDATSGVYFCRLSVEGGRWSETKRMVLLR